MKMSSTINLYNVDCMDMLKQVPDKYYSLSICDPPYGIGDKLCVGGCKKPNRMKEMYLAGK
jgi:DNA modification methylase